MQQEMTRPASTQVGRPLHVLVPLIKQDVEAGDAAAEQAGLPYYIAAGEKMIEAKSQMRRGEFEPWLKRHFPKIGRRTAGTWMQAARAVDDPDTDSGIARPPSAHSLRGTIQGAGSPNHGRPSPWHNDVKRTLNGVDTETLSRRHNELKRAEEREAHRKLALQLIDIGFKALATRLHPDKKGGSPEAMTRLNQVRDRLKLHA